MPTKKSKKSRKKGKKRKGESQDSHGSSDDINAMLEESQGDWKEREEPSFGDIPDSKYVVRIEKAEVNKSKNSGRLQVSWHLKIAEGDFVNRLVFKHDGLDSSLSMGYFAAGLNRLGEESPDDLTQIPGIIEGLINTFCEITLRTKGENQNTYFNKAVDDDAVDGEGLEELGEGGDDPADNKDAGAEEAEIEVGNKVFGPEFGDDEPAEVTKIRKGKVTITYESDDTTGTFKIDELTLIEEEGDGDSGGEGEEAEIEVGSTVFGPEYGKDEEAEVTKISKGKATIKYNDGETGSFPVDDLTLVEEEGEISFDFNDDDLKKSDLKKIKTLAKEHGYERKDFESDSEMLFDIAEFLEIEEVEYENAKEVFEAIEEKAE